MNYDKLLERVGDLHFATRFKEEYASREMPIGLRSALDRTIDQYCIAQVDRIKTECENLLVEYGPKNKLPTQTHMCDPVQSTSFSYCVRLFKTIFRQLL